MYRHLRKSSAKTRPRRFLDTAQGLVEYALILALVAVLAVGATAYLGGQVGSTLSNVGGEVLGADEDGPTPAPTPTPAGNPGDHRNAPDCWAAGFFWYSKQLPRQCREMPSNYHNSADCVAAGYYWYRLGQRLPQHCARRWEHQQRRRLLGEWLLLVRTLRQRLPHDSWQCQQLRRQQQRLCDWPASTGMATIATTARSPPDSHRSASSCDDAGCDWHNGRCRGQPSYYTTEPGTCEAAGYDWDWIGNNHHCQGKHCEF